MYLLATSFHFYWPLWIESLVHCFCDYHKDCQWDHISVSSWLKCGALELPILRALWIPSASLKFILRLVWFLVDYPNSCPNWKCSQVSSTVHQRIEFLTLVSLIYQGPGDDLLPGALLDIVPSYLPFLLQINEYC